MGRYGVTAGHGAGRDPAPATPRLAALRTPVTPPLRARRPFSHEIYIQQKNPNPISSGLNLNPHPVGAFFETRNVPTARDS